MTFSFKGVHFICSYIDCNYSSLINIEHLKRTFIEATKSSGASILNLTDYIFNDVETIDNVGYTCAIILSESHSSIHTYPEHKSCFVDLFTCGNKCDYHPFDKIMRDYLKPESVDCQILIRGEKPP